MSLISSFSDILTNNSLTLSHPRNASTSPKKVSPKDKIIQQITSLMSLELNKIDTRDIETKLSIYFNLNENDESNKYIQSLCSKINEVKNSVTNKVKNYLNHNINNIIENINTSNSKYFNNISEFNTINNYTTIDDSEMKNKFKAILKEIKILNNNSRIKFKKLYDNLSNEYDKILSTIYDYLQKGNSKLVVERLNRVEQLKNDILFDVTSIENIQNKFTDVIKNIINKDNRDNKSNEKNKKNDKNIKGFLGRTKTNITLHKKNMHSSLENSFNNSDNSLYINKLNESSYMNSRVNLSLTSYNKDENECIKLYRIKIKEKKNEIDKLKMQLQQEKESKNKIVNELNKLQYYNKMLTTIKNSQKNATNEEKFNKLIEMIIGFTYSMNNLRNNLYQKTISHIDAKNIYGKLKTKLISLTEEASYLKNDIINNENNKKDNLMINKEEDLMEDMNENINENLAEIKTIKEENENSQILTERDTNNNQINPGNIVNNNITLTTLPNYSIEVLLQENKNLRNQLNQKFQNTSLEKEKSEENNNLNEALKEQIIELKKIIAEKDREIEEKHINSMKNQKEDLNNIILNNNKNLEQLKATYQLLIDGKDTRIKELEEEIISYEKEIDTLKEENSKLKNEYRKDKILSVAEVNNLKNQKMELQCLLEQGNSNNNLINMNNNNDKIKKLENEINIKNKQIILLTQNHENDLKELNLAIEMLKHKISQLEEENSSLSERNKKNNNKNDKYE